MQQLLIDQFCESADLANHFPLIHRKPKLDQYIDLLTYSRFLGHRPTLSQQLSIIGYQMTGRWFDAQSIADAANEALIYINRLLPEGYAIERGGETYNLVNHNE